MKTTLLLLCATLLALPVLAQTPTASPPTTPSPVTIQVVTPAAVPLSPEAFQSAGLKWIEAFKTLAMAALGAVSIVALAVVALWQRVRAVEGRADRSAANNGSMQGQITQLAMALPPGAVTLAPATTPPEDKAGSTGILAPALAVLALLVVIGAATACSTTGPDPVKNARNAGLNAAGTEALHQAESLLGKAVTASLYQVASQELTGSKVDFGHAAVAGLYATVDANATAGAIGSTVNAYSAGKAAQTAREATKAAAPAIAAGANPVEVAHMVAAVISTAAGAPPAK